MKNLNIIFCFVVFTFLISNFSYAAISSFDDVDIKKYQQIYENQFEILRDLEKSAELQLNELGIVWSGLVRHS